MQARQNLIWHVGMRQGLFVVLMKDMHSINIPARLEIESLTTMTGAVQIDCVVCKPDCILRTILVIVVGHSEEAIL